MKGIRYATPPIGSLRFQKPLPLTYNTSATLDATAPGPPCVQPYFFDSPTFLPPGEEDCLFLNIRTPTLNNSANLPVMIWIHGGGFIFGSATQRLSLTSSVSQIYDGKYLAARNVVVISINYRLGVFGFMNGNRSDAPGNQGLWDQAMAINWTRQNIAMFGGNPNQITLFGESAGSISISYHIVSNVTRNWFQGVIMESGILLYSILV